MRTQLIKFGVWPGIFLLIMSLARWTNNWFSDGWWWAVFFGILFIYTWTSGAQYLLSKKTNTQWSILAYIPIFKFINLIRITKANWRLFLWIISWLPLSLTYSIRPFIYDKFDTSTYITLLGLHIVVIFIPMIISFIVICNKLSKRFNMWSWNTVLLILLFPFGLTNILSKIESSR